MSNEEALDILEENNQWIKDSVSKEEDDPYYRYSKGFDAIETLRDSCTKKRVKPIIVHPTQNDWPGEWACGYCKSGPLDKNDLYCRYCGTEINWGSQNG